MSSIFGILHDTVIQKLIF